MSTVFVFWTLGMAGGILKSMEKPIIFICSRFAGDSKNKDLARIYCRYTLDTGKVPFAPHLYFTTFLKEATQRQIGIDCGKAVMAGACTEVWVFVVNGYISEGMRQEIDFAIKIGKPLKWFACDAEITPLPHLSEVEYPKECDLLSSNKNAEKIAELFHKMEARLKSGDFYEDCLEEIDETLDTKLESRDKELEGFWHDHQQ